MEKLLHMKKLLITVAMILSAAVTLSAQEDSPARTLEQFEADCRSTLLHGKQLPDTVYIHATASYQS